MIPLHFAIIHNNLEIVKNLLNFGADVDELCRNCHRTPLFQAVFYGHLEIVGLLLDHKADVNKMDIYGETPLFEAILKEEFEIAQLLLKFGANVNKITMIGDSSLYWSVSNGDLKIVQLLIKYGANINPYIPNQLEINSRLVENVRINSETDNPQGELDIENNPLYHAKMLGHSKIVEFLEIHLERQTKLREYFNSEIWINDPELFMCLPEQFQSHANILVQLWDNIGRIDITDGKGFSVLPIELFHILLIELYFTM